MENTENLLDECCEKDEGISALIHASKVGHVQCVRRLLCAPTYHSKFVGYTALVAAAASNQPECVRILIRFVVHMTIYTQLKEILFIPSQGADVNHQTERGRSALHMASSRGTWSESRSSW